MLLPDIIIFCLGKKERLREYISQDVNLSSYVKQKHPYYIALAHLIALKQPGLAEQAKTLSHESVLELIKVRRPDLYSVIATPEGKKWFYNKVKFEEFVKL